MIKLIGINKSFGSVKVLQDISLELPDSEIMAISGPTGCGKTTLFRMIAGLEIPDSGEIYSDDQLLSKKGWILEPSQRDLGFVFQKTSLWPHMNVRQNIQFGLINLSKEDKRSVADSLMEDLQISSLQSRFPSELSGGESRLVSIARSLAPRPKLLLFDEPLVNLNKDLKDIAIQCIKNHLEKSKSSMIYVTHDLGELKNFKPRVIKMDKGILTE